MTNSSVLWQSSTSSDFPKHQTSPEGIMKCVSAFGITVSQLLEVFPVMLLGGVHRQSVHVFYSPGAMKVGMMLKIRVEIRSEFAKKTAINPSFQCVYRLPGWLRVCLRTVNSPF